MPLYEYYCRSCSSTFELLRSMSNSAAPTTCPAGHAKAERVVSLVAARARERNGSASEMSMGGGCGSCAGGACACGTH